MIIDTAKTLPSAEYLSTAIRAAQGSLPRTAPLSQVLQINQNQIGQAVPLANVSVLLRDDPIFRLGFSVYRDEREWKGMENAETAISTPMSNVIRSILGYGWTVEVGRKRSKAADLLKDFARQALERIELFEVALAQILRSFYYGWQPIQAVWYEKDEKTPAIFRFKGKPYPTVRQLVEQPGEYFHATPDDRLVFGGDGMNLPVLYEGPDELAWFRPRAGSTRGPYGRAALAYLWVDWYILKRFRQFYEEGARTALEGIPVFSQRGTGGLGSGIGDPKQQGKDRRLELSTLYQEIQTALAYKKTMGALVVPTGFDFKEMVKIEASTGWQQALEYLRTQLQIAIEGTTLTNLGNSETGSRATGDVLQAVKIENCKSVAGIIDPQITRDLVHRIILFNIPSADPEDLPRFVFRIRRRVDPDRAKVVSDLGYQVDILAAADDWGIPLETDEEGRPVKKQPAAPFAAPGAPGLAPGSPAPPDQQGDRPREATPPAGSPDATAEPSRQRGAGRSEGALSRLADESDDVIGALEQDAGGRAASAYQGYIRALESAVLEVAADDSTPFPLTSASDRR